jgi:hypothetical protein
MYDCHCKYLQHISKAHLRLCAIFIGAISESATSTITCSTQSLGEYQEAC